MEYNKVFRMKSTVALVYSDGNLDIFMSNTREHFTINIHYDAIVELLFSLNGVAKVRDILHEYPEIDELELSNLLTYLNQKRILIEVNSDYEERELIENHRLISLLEDFHYKTSEVTDAMKLIASSSVLIVGLGGVGTWIADSLARLGVTNFILVDDDIVDASNIHRQDLFFESDIGKNKIDVVHDKLLNISNHIKVEKIYNKLTEDFFLKHLVNFGLAVNCADFPNVDITSEIIAKESMKRNVPHVIGGGYNLHLTLVGQTVIPNITACFKCFEKYLAKINAVDLNGVKKLARKDRKIGSFAPLCALSASLTANEIFKILIKKYSFINNDSKRIEFNIRNRDFSHQAVAKDPECGWCGENGIFRTDG